MTLCYEGIEKQINFWIIESKPEFTNNIIVKSNQEKLKKLYDLLQEFFGKKCKRCPKEFPAWTYFDYDI